MRKIWHVEPEWGGETCFIVAGGTSVEQAPLERLRGRRIIVINSSYERVPFADILFFADARWWQIHRWRPPYREFAGRIATTSPNVHEARVHRLQRSNPPGLAPDCSTVVMRRTSVAASINLAAHLGVERIVLIGVDGRAGADGRTHHHLPHPWLPPPNVFAEQLEDLAGIAKPIADRGIAVVNASPGSAIALWPAAALGDILDTENARAA